MPQRLAHEPLTILMVDDSEDDAFFVRRALEKSGIHYVLHHVTDGADAVAYMKAEKEFSDRQKYPFPNVLLCDLKMPHMDGFAILGWLAAHPACRVIPTIMFSSSSADSDVHQSYLAGANAYLQKPGSPEDFAEDIKALVHFWGRAYVPAPPPGDKCS